MCEHHDHRMRDAPAIERFVEWLLPKTSELVGVANLATRCGFAAGGRLRAAPTRCGGNRGLAGRQVGDPYVAHSIDNVFTHLQLMQSS